MLGQGAMFVQGGKVHLGGVTLVAIESVLGILFVELLHLPVPGHLGQNGRG